MSNVTNPLLDAWRAGRPTVGLWCTMAGAFQAELAAAQGYDYLCLDQQHGMIDDGQIPGMAAGTSGRGAAVVIRTPGNEAWQIMKALDSGAHGVIIPMVNSGAEAARAVAACRYPPTGIRSYGPSRAAVVHETAEPRALEAVACIPMIETAGGLDNVDEIVTTAGVDCVYVGPSDLSFALGMEPAQALGTAAHEDAIALVLDSCRRHGVTAGIQCPDGATAKRRLDQGFQMVSAGGDAPLFRRVLGHELAIARGR